MNWDAAPAAPVESTDDVVRSRRIVRIVFILFCIEIGLVLLLLPWTLLWDNNYFLSLEPRWSSVLLSSYTRGAVSGLGIVNLWIAFSEALRISQGR